MKTLTVVRAPNLVDTIQDDWISYGVDVLKKFATEYRGTVRIYSGRIIPKPETAFVWKVK